jgi:hypothetical protein
VAITAHRIKYIDDSSITFAYKDYADGDKIKHMTLLHEEFLRRFEQHILPRGFVKIRHAGFLTNRNKYARIATILQQLGLPTAKAHAKIPAVHLLLIKTGIDVTRCPKCEVGKMELVATYICVKGHLINIKNIHNKGSPCNNKTIMP